MPPTPPPQRSDAEMAEYVVLRYSAAAPPLWVLCDDDGERTVGRIVQTGLGHLADHLEVPGTAVPCPLNLGNARAWVIDGVDHLVGVTRSTAHAEAGALACEETYSVEDFLIHINWPDLANLDDGAP
jgi:hypothetical protein